MMTRRDREDFDADLELSDAAFDERLERHDPLAAGVFAAVQGAIAHLPDHDHRAFVRFVIQGLADDIEFGKFDVCGGEHPPWRRDGVPPVEFQTWAAVRAAAKPEQLASPDGRSGLYVWYPSRGWHGCCPPAGIVPRILTGIPWPTPAGFQGPAFATVAEALAFLDAKIAAAGPVEQYRGEF